MTTATIRFFDDQNDAAQAATGATNPNVIVSGPTEFVSASKTTVGGGGPVLINIHLEWWRHHQMVGRLKHTCSNSARSLANAAVPRGSPRYFAPRSGASLRRSYAVCTASNRARAPGSPGFASG